MAKSAVPFDGNGTHTFASSALGEGLLSISYEEDGHVVDVTGAGDSEHTYEAGTPDVSVTIEVLGTVDTATGSKGALVIAGLQGSIAAAILASNSQSGSLSGGITSTLVFKPSSAAA
jgi:hypothetical protein